MALVAGLWSCQEGDANKNDKPIVPDVELTADEIANGVLTPELLWKFGRVGGVKVSPDGKTVMYSVTRYSMDDNRGTTAYFTIPAEGGEPTELPIIQGKDFGLQWRPDGKKIAFLSNRSGENQLWEMELNGTKPVQISFVDKGINSFSYSPTQAHVLFTKNVQMLKTTKDHHPDMEKANVRIIDGLMYRHWSYWNDGSFSHIFVAPLENGKLGQAIDIMEGEPWASPLPPYSGAGDIAWSPCGKTIAYVSKKMDGNEFAVSTNSSIYLYSLENGETENITEGLMGYDRYPTFSPDGSKIAWQSMKTPGYESDITRLYVYSFETGQRENLTKDFDQNVDNIVWGSCGGNILFISGTRATEQIYRINLESKDIKQITEGWHNYTGFSLADGQLVATRTTMSMDTEVYAVSLKTGEATQLTFTNQNIYDNIKMGEVTQRWVKTTDGKQMHVWVVLPPNFDENEQYPALLLCQGGPQSTMSQSFSYRWNIQLMAAHGYAVVCPNRRGVPSFGQEWNAQISGDYSGQNIKDYLSAIDNVKKEPWVDENRLGAVGASYGGYSVYYLAGVHENRFKAFIAHNGMFNLESFYASTEELFFANHDLGGPYWDKKNAVAQRTYANSPHRLVQNWNTPILIIVGEYDFRIAYTEGLQAFNSAQMLGVPSRLLVFPDETHFVTKPQNAIVWQREFFGWLDNYLK